MFKIVAEEQGWLDSFNGRYGTDYKQGDIVEEDELVGVNENGELHLSNEIIVFNHVVAQGEAIWLEDVEKPINIKIYTERKVSGKDFFEITSESKDDVEIMIDVFKNNRMSGVHIKDENGRTIIVPVLKLIVDGKKIEKVEK